VGGGGEGLDWLKTGKGKGFTEPPATKLIPEEKKKREKKGGALTILQGGEEGEKIRECSSGKKKRGEDAKARGRKREEAA